MYADVRTFTVSVFRWTRGSFNQHTGKDDDALLVPPGKSRLEQEESVTTWGPVVLLRCLAQRFRRTLMIKTGFLLAECLSSPIQATWKVLTGKYNLPASQYPRTFPSNHCLFTVRTLLEVEPREFSPS